MKPCQNQFKVGGRYIYAFDNKEGHTEALVEIVRKTNSCAIIKFIEIYTPIENRAKNRKATGEQMTLFIDGGKR